MFVTSKAEHIFGERAGGGGGGSAAQLKPFALHQSSKHASSIFHGEKLLHANKQKGQSSTLVLCILCLHCALERAAILGAKTWYECLGVVFGHKPV